MSSKMWFGTEARMRWIDTPLSGADISAQSWSSGGTLLDGGGYGRTSFDSHHLFNFSWSNASTREAAATMDAYASGSFGEGLIHFVDPLTYRTNILPKHWADPSLALRGGVPLVMGAKPTAAPTPDSAADLPVLSAVYELPADYNSQTAGTEVAIPIPPGMRLGIGVIHKSVGSSGAEVYIRVGGSVTALEPIPAGLSYVPLVNWFSGSWAYLGLRNTKSAARSIQLTGAVAKLATPIAIAGAPAVAGYGEAPYGEDSYGSGGDDSGLHLPAGLNRPWIAGEGHSGCRFVGHPTRVLYNGVGGGQVGYAVSLREVGAWQR